LLNAVVVQWYGNLLGTGGISESRGEEVESRRRVPRDCCFGRSDLVFTTFDPFVQCCSKEVRQKVNDIFI